MGRGGEGWGGEGRGGEGRGGEGRGGEGRGGEGRGGEGRGGEGVVSEPDPRKIGKDDLLNGSGWKCTLWNVRNFINC